MLSSSFTTNVESSRPPVRTARMSLQHVPYAQHQPRLSLVPESPSPRPDSMIFRRQSILPIRDTVKRRSVIVEPPKEAESPQLSHASTSRSNSDSTFYAPIRRRSLQQHGVATRNSWVDNDSRATLPSQAAAQEDLQSYYYDPAKPASSPLTDLVNMAPHFTDYVPGEPRAQTPNDHDYAQIGAFKLGSLRITNGAASPAPSLERAATMDSEEHYVNTVNGRESYDQRHAGQRSHTISVPSERIVQPWITRAESPLAQETDPSEKLESLTINTHLPLPEFSLFTFTDGHRGHHPTRSLDLARDYQSDIALSPFSFENSPPASPRLEATSKLTAIEADLFEAEPETPGTPEFRGPRSFDSGYRAEEFSAPLQSKVVRGPKDSTPKPLAKADSGYSSNVSLRSFKGNQDSTKVREPRSSQPKEPVRVASSTYSISSSSYSISSDVTVRQDDYPLPALPTRDYSPAPLNRDPPVPQKAPIVKVSQDFFLVSDQKLLERPSLALSSTSDIAKSANRYVPKSHFWSGPLHVIVPRYIQIFQFSYSVK
jgi:hypothetical protein